MNAFGASFSRHLKAGRIIVCSSGTLGFPVILGVDGCIHDGWLYIYDYKDLDTWYFYYPLQTQWAYFFSVASGAAIQSINTDILRNTQIRLPPLSQQQRIVEVLTTYDTLIEHNLCRRALLEESARLLYCEWFVRFPGHERTKIADGVPVGWCKAPLVDITTKLGSGSTPRGGEAVYLTEGITLIRSLNVYDDRFDEAGLAFICDDQAAALNNVTVEAHDIL